MGKYKDSAMAVRIGDFAGSAGRGLLAGFVGTAAITVSQLIEMKITGRQGSDAPAKAVEKTLPVKAPDDEDERMLMGQLVHWDYGTSWGIPLGLMREAGVKSLPASLIHFVGIWGTALVMLPSLDLAPPVTEWSSKQIAIDMAHHGVYATAAGLAYERLSRK